MCPWVMWLGVEEQKKLSHCGEIKWICVTWSVSCMCRKSLQKDSWWESALHCASCCTMQFSVVPEHSRMMPRQCCLIICYQFIQFFLKWRVSDVNWGRQWGENGAGRSVCFISAQNVAWMDLPAGSKKAWKWVDGRSSYRKGWECLNKNTCLTTDIFFCAPIKFIVFFWVVLYVFNTDPLKN